MVNWRFWEKKDKHAKRVLNSKVQRGIKVLATEHAAFLRLQEDLKQLEEDIQKRMKEREMSDIKKALRDLRFLGRAERRLEPTEEEIAAILNRLLTTVGAPSLSGFSYNEMKRHIEELTRDLEIEAGKILTAASRYEGKIHNLLQRLNEEVQAGHEVKAKETIEEIEKIIAEVDQKWIPALAADFKKARKIEEEFVRTSGSEEEANTALREGRYSEAAKLFWQANKPKKVISSLGQKRSLTPEDEDLLLRACIAARDAERAGNVAISLDQAAIARLITQKEVGKLAKHLEDHIVRIYIRCGDKLLKAWERILERIERAPFDKLKGNEKEWILGYVHQKLLHWEIAAKHYEKAGDLAAAVLCWAKTKNKAQLDRVKAELQKQRGR